MVELIHFGLLVKRLCDGETLGSQGSDVLLSRGGEVGVVVVVKILGSCALDINVFEKRVLLLIGHDRTNDFVKCLS